MQGVFRELYLPKVFQLVQITYRTTPALEFPEPGVSYFSQVPQRFSFLHQHQTISLCYLIYNLIVNLFCQLLSVVRRFSYLLALVKTASTRPDLFIKSHFLLLLSETLTWACFPVGCIIYIIQNGINTIFGAI